jgi:hypothetical protein
MRLDDFRQLVDRLLQEVRPAYLRGVVAVEVSAKAVPHPVRADVYTLGECIPIEWSGDGTDLQSRIVLYHGSFQALAHHGDFDWREETWETLTHELRHHLEWRARVGELEAYDWAAEQNFARHEGHGFDPAYYRSGERVADGVFKVDDDVFLEGPSDGPKTHPVEVLWRGRRYRVAVPLDLRAPAFVSLTGLAEPPPGDAVLVLRRRASLLDLFRRVSVTQLTAVAEPIDR